MLLRPLFAAIIVIFLQIKLAFSYQCDVKEDSINGTTKGFYPGARWPNNIVKYRLDASLTPANILEIQKAFNEIQSKTCIRFQEPSPGEAGFVKIYRHTEGCADATICYTGGEQYLRFSSPGCDTMSTIVHELGHSLCLTHEHERKDRDDYVTFNAPCDPNPFKNDYDTRGHPYDYASQMHYQCFTCSGGWPKQAGVSGCGQTVTVGLSVVDADKINEFYGCGGRYAHRWVNIAALTEADVASIAEFSTNEGAPLHLCRASVNGKIVAGRFSMQSRSCFIAVNDMELPITTQAQVFTLPKADAVDSGNSMCEYKTIYMNTKLADNHAYIPVGTNVNGATGYAAVIKTTGNLKTIGTVWEDDLNNGRVKFLGQHVEADNFAIVSCQ